VIQVASPASGKAEAPPRAVPAGTRALWMLLALLPGAALAGWTLGSSFALRIGTLVGAIAVLDRLVAGRARPGRWSAMPVLMAAIGVLWLPSTMSWWATTVAAVVAWACARAFAGLPGQAPFHPAMVGCALALVLFPPHVLPTAGMWQILGVAGAWFAAGIALAATRCIRWQVPLAAWLGFAVAYGTWRAAGASPPDLELLWGSIPAFVLGAFLVASDPSSGCLAPRARWIFGGCIGVGSGLSMLVFHDVSSMFLGMAGSILLANAAAPWLDRRFHPRRTMAPNR